MEAGTETETGAVAVMVTGVGAHSSTIGRRDCAGRGRGAVDVVVGVYDVDEVYCSSGMFRSGKCRAGGGGGGTNMGEGSISEKARGLVA